VIPPPEGVVDLPVATRGGGRAGGGRAVATAATRWRVTELAPEVDPAAPATGAGAATVSAAATARAAAEARANAAGRIWIEREAAALRRELMEVLGRCDGGRARQGDLLAWRLYLLRLPPPKPLPEIQFAIKHARLVLNALVRDEVLRVVAVAGHTGAWAGWTGAPPLAPGEAAAAAAAAAALRDVEEDGVAEDGRVLEVNREAWEAAEATEAAAAAAETEAEEAEEGAVARFLMVADDGDGLELARPEEAPSELKYWRVLSVLMTKVCDGPPRSRSDVLGWYRTCLSTLVELKAEEIDAEVKLADRLLDRLLTAATTSSRSPLDESLVDGRRMLSPSLAVWRLRARAAEVDGTAAEEAAAAARAAEAGADAAAAEEAAAAARAAEAGADAAEAARAAAEAAAAPATATAQATAEQAEHAANKHDAIDAAVQRAIANKDKRFSEEPCASGACRWWTRTGCGCC